LGSSSGGLEVTGGYKMKVSRNEKRVFTGYELIAVSAQRVGLMAAKDIA